MKETCKFPWVTAVILLTVTVFLQAQTASKTSQTPNLRVEVKTDKTDYAVGEAIYVTTTLANVGNSVAYIAKTFFESGGGIAGFSVSVSQLTGKRAEHGCSRARDRFCLREARTLKQILQEDFLRLAPGAIVGYRFLYAGCVVAHSGTYEITSTYCACDCNTELVRSLPEYANQIARGALISKPWVFHVR
jgi:hypothetical protein